jgi:hypothetical protein
LQHEPGMLAQRGDEGGLEFVDRKGHEANVNSDR